MKMSVLFFIYKLKIRLFLKKYNKNKRTSNLKLDYKMSFFFQVFKTKMYIF